MKQLSDKIDIATIVSLINSPDSHAIVSGYRVKVGGVRLTTFAQKGTDCICCPRKGEFFRVEENGSGAHLNLYAYGTDGREKLMTRDHIIPRSHKGPETVANMSPMCQRCNSMRGTLDQAEFIADYQAGRYARDGDITVARIDAKVERRKVGRIPQDELTELVDRHIVKWGYESHMHRIWWKTARKAWVREEAIAACTEKYDLLGLEIMSFVMKGETQRNKVGNYAKAHGLAVTPEANKMDIRQAFGVLMTSSRQHLDNPTELSAAKLRKHLRVCKELR